MKRNNALPAHLRAAIGVLTISLMAVPASAQLTRKQKVQDFQNLAALYAKRYAPYEWKKELFSFDLFEISPWLDRIERSTDDLEFFEIALEYVASLRDTHSQFIMPSSFVASLGFSVDVYEGRVLIDAINRTRLPEAQFPFQVGDALLSVDGRTSEEWIRVLLPFPQAGQPTKHTPIEC